jgi:hypothetical protein
MTLPSLDRLLRRAGRLALASEATRWLCLGSMALLAAAGLAILLDGLLALPPAGLYSVDVLLVLLAAVAVALAIRRAWANRYEPRRLARRVEQQLGLGDSRLINAVDLAATPPAHASAALRERAVAAGEAAAAQLAAGAAVDLRPMLRAVAWAGAALLLAVAGWSLAPRLCSMVAARYLDPAGDHPPYSALDFAVTVEPEPVYHGRPATVAVRVTGPRLPEAADLVFVGGDEAKQAVPLDRQAMLRRSEGEFAFSLDRAGQTRQFYIDTPLGRSRRMTLEVVAVPFFERVEVGYDFPSYADWPPETAQPLDSRGIRALEGTQITLTVASNIPLARGVLELVPPDEPAAADAAEDEPAEDTAPQPRTIELKPRADDPKTVEARFALDFTGQYRLRLEATNGAASLETLAGPIAAIADKLPQVEIIEPTQHVIAVEDWQVPVTVHAVDDVALGDVELFCAINGWGPTETALKVQRKARHIALGQYEFDLAALGARAGDVITYYASAHDTRPGGERFSDTDTYVIQVISEAEYVEFARQQYRLEQLTQEINAFRRELERLRMDREDLLEELQALEEKLASGEELSAEEQERLAELQQQLEDYAQQAAQVAEQMQQRAEQPQLYDFEQQYQESLKELSEQLQQQAQSAGELSRQLAPLAGEPMQPPDLAELQQAMEDFQQQQAPFDQQGQQPLDGANQDMELLKQADDMLQQADRLRSIVERQRDLADRLGQFREQPELSPEDQQRANRLAKEQELLEQELQDAVEKLEQCAGDAQEKLPRTAGDAQKLCQAIRDLGITDDQSQSARQCRGGNGQQGHAKAESAAEKLESLATESCYAQGVAGEMASLDQGLQLSKQGLVKALQQLAQGRLPGMMPGQQPGQTGSGQRGSQAKTTIFGPHLPEGQPSDPTTGRTADAQAAQGDGPGFDSADAAAAETLEPEARAATASASGNLRGVPVGYRDQAEAYFQRLAEEK